MNYNRTIFFFLSSVIFLSLINSCKKEKFFTIDLYGHAGNGLDIVNSVYHDNSQESIEFALGLEGTTGVEVDMRMSADGGLWLYHDDLLETETSGSGCVSQKTNSELNEIRYNTVNKEKLVNFSNLPFINYGNTTFLLDVRHYNGCDFFPIDYNLFVSKIIDLRNNHPSIKFVILTTFDDWIPLFIAQGMEVYFEISNVANLDSATPNTLSCQGYIIKNQFIDKNEVAKIQAENKKVIIFELRSPKKIREALKKNPNGIVTDDLRAAIIEKH